MSLYVCSSENASKLRIRSSAYSLDGGGHQALTPAGTGSGVNSDGEACSLLRFLIPDAAEKTLSLRFTLSSSATLVRECCGILL